MSPVPPTPPLPPMLRAAAPGAVTLTVVGGARAVAEVPPDAVLEARVVEVARGGRLAVLQTDLGTLQVRSTQPLRSGGTLSLQLMSVGSDTAALRVTSLNGQPLPPIGTGAAGAAGAGQGGAAAPGTPGAGSGPGAGAGAGAGAGGAVPVGQGLPGRGLLTATVLGGSVGAGQLPAGSRMAVQVLSIQPPGQGTGAVPNVGLGAAGGPGTGPAPGVAAAPGPGAGAGAPGAAASGGPVGAAPSSASAATPAQPSAPSASPTSPQAGGAPSGGAARFGRPLVAASGAASSVTQGESSGPPSRLTGSLVPAPGPSQSLLRTPSGTLALPVRLEAPPGSQVMLAVRSFVPPTGAAGMPPAGAALPQGGVQGWPVLTEALETLTRVDPAAARALESAIPRPGPQLAGAMVSLAGALRAGGDSRLWPGDATLRALERAGPSGARAAGALRRDLADLASRVRESPGGEWRAFTMPFSDQAEISAVAVILRVIGGRGDDHEDESGAEEREGGDGQRFLVDVTLSRLGRLQIDGLMEQPARRLRLILRTIAPLPPALRADLTRITARSLEAFGLEGGLTFRDDGAFFEPVPPSGEDGAAGSPPGGVIA